MTEAPPETVDKVAADKRGGPSGYTGTGDTACLDPLVCVADELGAMVDAGPLVTELPPTCTGDTRVCCTGGVVVSPCGPLQSDFTEYPGESPRLVATPVDPDGLDVIVRARVRSQATIPVEIDTGMGTISCGVAVDTTLGTTPRVELHAHYTRLEGTNGRCASLTSSELVDFSAEDLIFSGGFECSALGSVALPLLVSTLTPDLAVALSDAVTATACSSCPCEP